MPKVKELLNKPQIWWDLNCLMILSRSRKGGNLVEMILWLVMVLFFRPSAMECFKGSFRLRNMSGCHLFLKCHDLMDIKILDQIGHGTVKTVYRAKWLGNIVALSELRSEPLQEDFMHGWEMLQLFQGPFFVQPVGFCFERKIIMTEYHPNGNAIGLIKKLPTLGIDPGSPIPRINYCWNYAKILERLHDERFVNCDSNSLFKTLSQLLIADDGTLVINDLDSLAENIDGVTCGSKPLHGNFVAPEQKGYPLPRYGEKVDIWKVPEICSYFFTGVRNSAGLIYRLHEIHSKCKSPNAALRPSASELVAAYASIGQLVHDDF